MTTTFTVRFALERETKGALRYQEIDDSGNPLEITDGAKIGTLYVRKSAIVRDDAASVETRLRGKPDVFVTRGSAPPRILTVTVTED